MTCAHCKNITVCAICGKGYAEAVRAGAQVDSMNALRVQAERKAALYRRALVLACDGDEDKVAFYVSEAGTAIDEERAASGVAPTAPASELHAILAFLYGAAPLDGCWFGDGCQPTGQGRYWWRSRLRAALAASGVPGTQGDKA